MDMGNDVPEEERRARVLVEKKTVLNLVDAFCVAVNHYLRGESGMM
jgi:ion channel-forming bestrophin family protein